MKHVDVPDEQEAVAARLWREHLHAAFPADLRGAELAGADMVLLDADIAGCMSTWHHNGGVLDERRRRILRGCLADLDRVLPLLSEAEHLRYWQRLRRLAHLVSESQPSAQKTARPPVPPSPRRGPR